MVSPTVPGDRSGNPGIPVGRASIDILALAVHLEHDMSEVNGLPELVDDDGDHGALQHVDACRIKVVRQGAWG